MSAITVCLMTPIIGAEIEGVDLREELSDQVVEEIRDAWLKHQAFSFATRNLPTSNT
jgi:alpha-ketoglutarate-dependent taurine dioxygenase